MSLLSSRVLVVSFRLTCLVDSIVIGISSSTVEVIASPLIGPMGLGVHWVLRVWISSTTWTVATVWCVERLLILSYSSFIVETTSGLAAIWFIKVACV